MEKKKAPPVVSDINVTPMMDVVDNLRAAGVDQLGLLTEVQPQDTRHPNPPPGN